MRNSKRKLGQNQADAPRSECARHPEAKELLAKWPDSRKRLIMGLDSMGPYVLNSVFRSIAPLYASK
jgi:hypothetical protein